MNFFEGELHRMFGGNDIIHDPKIVGRTLLGKIDDDLRVKLQFVSTGIAKHYDAIQVSILNRTDGLVDRETMLFGDIIGVKNTNIQSFSQLDKNYGKEGAEIIVDNTQLTIFGGFAPNSSSAEVLSKALGSRTVMSGSVSRSRNDPSESLQMIERPLLTPDELKSLPKGQFVVMKTGVHPMRVKLKLFFKWGIEFDEDNPYAVPDHGGREVQYAEKKEIMDGIIRKYHPDWIVKDKPATDGGNGIGGQDQAESESHEPQQTQPKKPGDKKGGGGMNPVPPNRRTALKPAQEVKPNEPS
jgi:type IV secretion system protein VirD4